MRDPLLPALVLLLLAVRGPLAQQQRCPERLPDTATVQLYVACAEAINRQAMAEPEAEGGAVRRVWSDRFSSLLLVHDVPLLISRLPESITGEGKVEKWNRWLKGMEPEWRSSNGGIMQVSYTGSKNSYNVFREGIAAADRDVSKFARKLLLFLQTRFLALLKAFKGASSKAATPLAGKTLREGLGEDMCAGSRNASGACTVKNLVTLYAWCNMFHQSGPYKEETFIGRFHGHQHPWHGYLILNGSGTHTAFFSPFAGKFFALRHENNHMIMLPGGFKHAALHPHELADPRMTLAFDIRMGDPTLDVHGMDFFHDAGRLPAGMASTPLRRWSGAGLEAMLAAMQADTAASWGGVLPYARHVGKSAAAAADEDGGAETGARGAEL